MEFRRTNLAEVPAVIKIIEAAQQYFKIHGIDQWQNGYPNVKTIESDVAQGISYVLVSGQIVIATLVIDFSGDPNYMFIEGAWLSDQPYATVHRIAVVDHMKGAGIASMLLDHVEQLCDQQNVGSIRVDTHQDNHSMQRLLHKNDFVFCGIIYLQDGSERLAYEKVLV